MVLEIPERTLSPVVTMVCDAFKRLCLGVGEITLFHSFKSSFFFSNFKSRSFSHLFFPSFSMQLNSESAGA